MSDTVIVGLISGSVGILTSFTALIGVIITNKSANKKMQSDIAHKIEVAQAVTDTKIVELTREVREHNNFATRIPVLEEQVKVINHRIDDLK